MSDPSDIPGLAHFLEHMLFYSSEKYPQEDEYRWEAWLAGNWGVRMAGKHGLRRHPAGLPTHPRSKYIAEHGGKTNAFTSAESTNFHFDVNWDALPEALDR